MSACAAITSRQKSSAWSGSGNTFTSSASVIRPKRGAGGSQSVFDSSRHEPQCRSQCGRISLPTILQSGAWRLGVQAGHQAATSAERAVGSRSGLDSCATERAQSFYHRIAVWQRPCARPGHRARWTGSVCCSRFF